MRLEGSTQWRFFQLTHSPIPRAKSPAKETEEKILTELPIDLGSLPHASPLLDNEKVITYVIFMPIETKVRRIGNSLGIVLPKEALQKLRVEEGTTLYLTEAPNDSLAITPERPGFQKIMALAEEGMHRYRNALRELAK